MSDRKVFGWVAASFLGLGLVGQAQAQTPGKTLPAAQTPPKVMPTPVPPPKVTPTPVPPPKMMPTPVPPPKTMPNPQSPAKVMPTPVPPAKVMPTPGTSDQGDADSGLRRTKVMPTAVPPHQGDADARTSDQDGSRHDCRKCLRRRMPAPTKVISRSHEVDSSTIPGRLRAIGVFSVEPRYPDRPTTR